MKHNFIETRERRSTGHNGSSGY